MKSIKKSDYNKIKRQIKKSIKNKQFAAVLIVILAASTFYYNEVYLYQRETAETIQINQKSIRCVDGDTFKMDDKTIRLLAIDTPETVKPNTPVEPYGKEASDATCKLLSNAENIVLKEDKNNEIDKYGRQLAWVFLDDIFLQEYLLEEGLAEIKYVQKKTVDKSLLKRLELAESKAKEKGLGIHSLDK